MEIFLIVYLQPILSELCLKNDFFDISKFRLPMNILTFFQTSDDISRYKKCYLPDANSPSVIMVSNYGQYYGLYGWHEIHVIQLKPYMEAPY